MERALPESVAAEAARLMTEQVRAHGELLQLDAVALLVEHFGEQCVYENENGNFGIHRDILSVFKKQTGDDVVWDRGGLLWRRRQDYDPHGKRQVD